jgi:Tat protein translocase TatB subunit
VVLLILESLGSTELVFILVMALVFFGPRKLPQLSRSLGKNLADFRRASEDFKRTWDREVNLEETGGAGANANRAGLLEQNSSLENEPANNSLQTPTIGTIAPDRVIARHAPGAAAIASSDHIDIEAVTEETKHSPKSDWL